jgi:hypothetical protein
MRQRSRAGEPAKTHRRKTGARKSRIAPKAGHPRSTSTANLETEVVRLTAVVALKFPLVGLGMCIFCLIVYLKPEAAGARK